MRFTLTAAMVVSLLFAFEVSHAAQRSWQDNGDNPNWGFSLNWSPIGTPGSTDNIRLGNLAVEDTLINQDFTIDTLAINNGATADSAGNRLSVQSDVLISDPNSKFIASVNSQGPTSASLTADDLTLTASSTLELIDGFVQLGGSLSIGVGAEVRGFGRIDADRYFNDGTIVGDSVNDEVRFNTPGGTNLFDLDGASENGAVSALAGSIIIDAPLQDDFDGVISIGADHRVGFIEPVTIGSSGSVIIQGSSTLSPVPNRNLNTSTFINFDGNLSASLNSAVNSTKFRSGAKIGLANAADQLITLGPESSIGPGVTFTGNGQILAGSGTLTLEDDAQVAVPIQVGETTAVAINGNLAIGDVIGAAEVSILELTTRGDLEIDIAGRDFDEYDRLTTSFAANLAGDLEVTLLHGFVPRAGDSFQILQSLGSLTGQFRESGITLPTLPSNLSWDIDYDNVNGLVFLKVLSSLPADFNGDGIVDAADYTVWRDNLGAVDDSALSGNGDGLNGVDQADYDLWVANSGTTNLAGNSNAVPEPGTIALLVMGSAGGLMRCIVVHHQH